MSEWGITTKVPAEVVLAEGLVLAGDLHLYARPTYPPGPETPLEMLNRADVFFALTLDGGGVTFVPKTQVVVVTCRGPVADDGSRPASTAARRIELEVELAGRARSTGARSRRSCRRPAAGALDYLNGRGRLLRARRPTTSPGTSTSRASGSSRPLD